MYRLRNKPVSPVCKKTLFLQTKVVYSKLRSYYKNLGNHFMDWWDGEVIQMTFSRETEKLSSVRQVTNFSLVMTTKSQPSRKRTVISNFTTTSSTTNLSFQGQLKRPLQPRKIYPLTDLATWEVTNKTLKMVALLDLFNTNFFLKVCL